MVVRINSAVKALLHGDDTVIKCIKILEEGFQQGEKTALLYTIFICARYQAVLPDWAVDALLDMESGLANGKVNDPNAGFGWQPIRKGLREKRARQNAIASLVLGKLQQHRLSGGGLNADVDFQAIADELQVSRRDVEEIYKKDGQFIKALPKGGDNTNYCFARLELPNDRRYGRPILRDTQPGLDTKTVDSVSD